MITTVTKTTYLPPLLRWTGGKANQPTVYNRVAELYAPFRDSHIWVEPFCGGLGMSHRIAPQKAILSDINPHLIRFHKAIQSGVEFHWQTWMIGTPYEELREVLNVEIAGESQLSDYCFAALFYQINRRSFNGLWRVNRQGEFNVPVGRNGKGDLLVAPFPDTKPYQELMQGWEFRCGEWQEQLAIKSNGEPVNQEPRFIYCDPPYDCDFTQYSKESFGWFRQQQLAEWAAVSPHPVVISNAATDRIIELYSNLGFTIEIVGAKRSVSCNGDRKRVDEVIAWKGCEV